MLILQADIQRITQNADRTPWKEYIETLDRNCERWLGEAFPETDVTLHNWTLERARVLLISTVSLAVKYALSGEAAYARRAARFLLDSIPWELWAYKTGVSDAGPFDLGTGETAMAFAVALPLIRDQMTNEEHAACLAALNNRVLTPFLENTEPGEVKLWWHIGLNNWNCVCNGGMLAVACYLEANGYESERAALAEKRALAGMDIYFNHMHADGSCEEGTGYWGYATRYFVMSLIYWENFTGKRHPFFESDKARKWLRFPFEVTPGGAPLSFGDVNSFGTSGSSYAYAARVGDEATLSELYARANPAHADVWHLAFFREGKQAAPPPDKRAIWYPDNGWAVFTNGPLAMSFRSGSSNVSHAQKDLNSIQLARNGVALLSNIGNHPYTVGWFGEGRYLYWEDNTTSKNSQLVNGTGQMRLAEAACSFDGAKVVSDAAPAYPRHAKSIVRAASVSGDGFLLEDSFDVLQEMWHEDRFLTRGRFTLLSEARCRVDCGGESAVLEFSCDAPFRMVLADVSLSVYVDTPIHMLRVITKDPIYRSSWRVAILPE